MIERFYDRGGNWNPEGTPEDPTRCVVEVTGFDGFHGYQCSRRRTVGELCRQHATMKRDGKPLRIPGEGRLW